MQTQRIVPWEGRNTDDRTQALRAKLLLGQKERSGL